MSDQRTRIKICGITSPEMAEVVAEHGADFIGLVFARGSSRNIRDPRQIGEILDVVPSGITPVGVFLNAFADQMTALRRWLDPNRWCQFHGDVDDDELMHCAGRTTVLRGFRFDPDAVRQWEAHPSIHGLLVDGSAGGAGTGFDHSALADMMPSLQKPVFLAGGLTPENVGDAIRTVRPFAVDVSSGVESSRGVKDATKIRDFCRAVREADRDV